VARGVPNNRRHPPSFPDTAEHLLNSPVRSGTAFKEIDSDLSLYTSVSGSITVRLLFCSSVVCKRWQSSLAFLAYSATTSSVVASCLKWLNADVTVLKVPKFQK
jgi:hypothetical protein